MGKELICPKQDPAGFDWFSDQVLQLITASQSKKEVTSVFCRSLIPEGLQGDRDGIFVTIVFSSHAAML